MIGAVVVVIAIVAAIAKPWESGPPPPPVASVAAIATPQPSPSPTAATTQAPRATQAAPDWIAVTNAVTEHDAWGVTAILGHGPAAAGTTSVSPARYTELWTPTLTDASGADTAVVTRDGAEVAALGITVPDGVQPRGVRFWRLHQSNEFEWINAARIDNQAASHAPLLVRMPLLDGVASVPWEAGQYRVDVLIGNAIHRISVVIERQFGDVSGPDDWPSGTPDLVAATASDPSADPHRAVRDGRRERRVDPRSRVETARRGWRLARAGGRQWLGGRRDLPASGDRARGDADVTCRSSRRDDPASGARTAVGPAAGGGWHLRSPGSDSRTWSSPRPAGPSGRPASTR